MNDIQRLTKYRTIPFNEIKVYCANAFNLPEYAIYIVNTERHRYINHSYYFIGVGSFSMLGGGGKASEANFNTCGSIAKCTYTHACTHVYARACTCR